MYRHNTTATFQVKEYVKTKEMGTSHVAGELRLLAAIPDRMVATKFEMINSEAVEVICRRIYGLFRAWENVDKLSDWKQPRGESGKKWRSKVRWDLADEYDALALEGDDLMIDEADEEVRKRLERKALFSKYLDKAGMGSGASGARDDE